MSFPISMFSSKVPGRLWHRTLVVIAIALIALVVVNDCRQTTNLDQMPLTAKQRGSLLVAVNNAIQSFHSSNAWKYALSTSSIEFSNIADCVPQAPYPKTLNFLNNNNTLVLCRNAGAGIPWMTSSSSGYYFTFASLLKEELWNKYNTQVQIQWVDVNVSRSFFPALKSAVDNNECDLVLSNTVINANRSEQVDFGCAHSAARDCILRSTLESSRVLDTMDKLSDPSVSVGIVNGAITQRPAKANITIVGSLDEGFEMIRDGQLHALLWNEVTVNSWVKANCPSCQVYPYGPVFQYGIYVKKGAEIPNSSTRILVADNLVYLWLLLLLALLSGFLV